MWPVWVIQASEGSRSTQKRRLWLGSGTEKKRCCRMGDSQAPAGRRGLQAQQTQLMVSYPAANSAWSSGRASA